jgi:hypothetical protein
VLDQYKKKKKRTGKGAIGITARIPKDLHQEFKVYCDALGLSLNEALYILIENEMKRIRPRVLQNEVKNEVNLHQSEVRNEVSLLQDDAKLLQSEARNEVNLHQNDAKLLQREVKVLQNEVKFLQSEVKNDANFLQSEVKMKNNRFTVKDYKLNDELYCPICKTWQNFSNFSRHAKTHGTSTKEIYTNPVYAREAAKALADRREKR